MVSLYQTYYNSSKLSYWKGCEIIRSNYNARRILANNIIHYRLEKGWSQEELADRLSTTPTYVSNLENAKRNTRIDFIERISSVMNIELYKLFEKREFIENHRVPRR